jgi:hypothetical protein
MENFELLLEVQSITKCVEVQPAEITNSPDVCEN